MTLFQTNQQSIGFSKQTVNNNGANFLILCQVPTVNDKVKKQKYNYINPQLIALTYALIDDEDATFVRIFENM